VAVKDRIAGDPGGNCFWATATLSKPLGQTIETSSKDKSFNNRGNPFMTFTS
jgi:hypothetical protein